MSSWNLFLAAFAAAALAGCAGGDPLTNEQLTASLSSGGARKSVCVISAIGDTFSLQKIGVTVFGNALDKHPIDAWGIDGFVGTRISAQLGQRFDARRIDYPKGAFSPLERVRSPFSGDYKDYRQEVRDILSSIVVGQRCDLCVVVTKSGSVFSNTNQAVSGLGILETGSPIITTVYLFALWEMRVYDGKTFAVLAHKRATGPDPVFLAVIRGPHRKVDTSWWPAPARLAQNAKLKQATLELLEGSIEPVVAELFASQ
jgi:hypothetical protein